MLNQSATVSEVASDTLDVFAGVVEAYRREGFDAGYERAMHDVLANLVVNSEEFLHEQVFKGGGFKPTPQQQQELRKLLYAFVARLERQIEQSSHHHGYVEGGLGI